MLGTHSLNIIEVLFCFFFIIVWLYLSWQNAICTKFWTGAVVRYYGYWKWYCSYIVCHKPIKCGHLVGNKLYFTKVLTFIPIDGKSKSYRHSLIIYWTALVYHIWKLCALKFQTRFLKIAFWKPIVWPRDLLMQPTRTVWTLLVEDHPGIIPVKFGQNPMSGFREEVVWMKKFTHARMHWRTTDCHNSSLWSLCAQVS